MMLHRRVALAGLLALSALAHAQEPVTAWPSRPVKVLLTVSAGSSSDIAMRMIGQAMSSRLGQPLVMENRPGAGGVLGATAVARSAPDGYTLGLITTSHVINPAVVKDIPYDSLKDFTPISLLASGGMVLLANAATPYRSVQDLVAAAKSHPKQIAYGSSGNGGLLHLYTAQIEHQAGIELLHVPYKGLTPMVQDLVGGQVQVGIAALPAAQAFLGSGQLRALAVTSKTRMSALPNVPSLAEIGFPGYDSTGWMVLVAPAGLPTAMQSRLHAAVKGALADPKVAEALAQASMDAVGASPADTVKFLRAESDKHLSTAAKIGLKPQ